MKLQRVLACALFIYCGADSVYAAQDTNMSFSGQRVVPVGEDFFHPAATVKYCRCIVKGGRVCDRFTIFGTTELGVKQCPDTGETCNYWCW